MKKWIVLFCMLIGMHGSLFSMLEGLVVRDSRNPNSFIARITEFQSCGYGCSLLFETTARLGAYNVLRVEDPKGSVCCKEGCPDAEVHRQAISAPSGDVRHLTYDLIRDEHDAIMIEEFKQNELPAILAAQAHNQEKSEL